MTPKKRASQPQQISRSAIEDARATLRAMLAENPPLSFRELVGQLYDEIEGFRKSGLSWQEIQSKIGAQIPIGIRTLQMYFHDEAVRRAEASDGLTPKNLRR